jgi:predicted KAP-like P-loop ATPase
MQALLDAADNAESFSDELIRLADEHQPDGKTRLRSVLQRLWDYTESEIEENDIPTIVEAMVSVGDQLIRPEDERTGMFDILGTDLMIWFHVRNLLLRLESSSRVDILAQTLEQSRSVSTVVNIASNLAYQYEPDRKDPVPPEERVVPEESLPRVTDIALKQIRDAASNGLLLRSPNLTHTLHRWKGWASGDEVRQWAASAIESDDDLLTFVDAFLNVRWVQGLGIMAGEGDVAARKYNRLDPKWLTDFIDPETIVNRLRNIVSDENIPETKKTSALQLLKEYDLRQEGKNPDSELR